MKHNTHCNSYRSRRFTLIHDRVLLSVIDAASKLLGIDGERLEAVMKERTMQLRGECITSPQSVDQVRLSTGVSILF